MTRGAGVAERGAGMEETLVAARAAADSTRSQIARIKIDWKVSSAKLSS